MFKTIALIYLAIVALMSVVTFLVYGWDKRQAKKSGWRTPESRLHGLALLGGWPGAILGQRVFRHKTQKLGFKLMTWLVVAVHLITIAIVCYLGWQLNRETILWIPKCFSAFPRPGMPIP